MVTLRLHARSGVEDEAFDKVLPAFEKAQNVKVIQEVFPGAEYPQKLQTLAAGGTIGDVLQSFTSDDMFHQFFVSGILAPVDDYIKRDKIDLAQWYKYSMEACVVEGKTGGLPFKSHPSRVGLFYNIDVFEKAGMKVPDLDWTYDQLVEAAVKLNKPPDMLRLQPPVARRLLLPNHVTNVRRRLVHQRWQIDRDRQARVTAGLDLALRHEEQAQGDCRSTCDLTDATGPVRFG